MAHKFQKRWVFTWNANSNDELPNLEILQDFLNEYVQEGVFQLEQGSKTGRRHYQGRFELLGERIGKTALLKLFATKFDIINLTFEPEVCKDSSAYCTKLDSRIDGPWFVGVSSHRQMNTKMNIELKEWQQQLLEELELLDLSNKRDRKVIWVQDPNGGAGKSTFNKYLSLGNTKWKTWNMPIENPDRTRMAICKIFKKQDVDLITFDFTRTRGEDTSMQNLFQVVEEIKNGMVTSLMYGNPLRVFFESPHIIIFTNEYWIDYAKYLSFDRWQPYHINASGLHDIVMEGGVPKFLPIDSINKKNKTQDLEDPEFLDEKQRPD